MSLRRWTTGALLAVVALAAHLAAAAVRSVETRQEAVIGVCLYLLAAASAIVVWRRGTARMGALILAWGIANLATDAWLFVPDSVVAVTFLPLLIDLPAALYAHMVLAYPSGRLRDRLDRVAVAVIYATALLPSAVLVLTWDPTGCPECRPSVRSLGFVDWLGRQPALDLAKGVGVIMGGLFLGLLVRRWLSVAPGARRGLWPIGIAAVFAVAQFVVTGIAEIREWWSWLPVLDRLNQIALLAVPLALASGVVLGERRRRVVGDLVVDLGAARPGRARDVLAEAVGDPSLELLLWEPSRGRWITTAGAAAELPTDSARAVTLIGDHLAAVVHDSDLADQAGVLRTAGAAALLALENERLQAELRAQVEELRASRARIVSVGDEERRRLERDLHDGAQQRLLGVGLTLQLLRPRLGRPSEAEAVLEEAEVELRTALEELRELARGIHPAILTEQGLEPALQSLASRSSVPVTVETDGCERLTPEIESAVYFVAAEALANVAKHADATSASLSLARGDGTVMLEVSDDGRGGADPSGSGLVGLADRIGALGGRLTLDSAAGAGTRLAVEIPCAS